MSSALPSKEHMTMYGPIYALLVIVLGGGGTAALTDSIPVTNGEFKAWAKGHTDEPHPITHSRLKANADAIDAVTVQLRSIQLGQLRTALRNAYDDKCRATNAAAISYIDLEIRRLKAAYYLLTDREYNPPPCIK